MAAVRRLAAALALALAVPAARADDLDEVLEGFETDEEFERVPSRETDEPLVAERWWDLSGSLDLSSSVAYLDHRSTTGTDWTGLTKLRTRLNLELDLELPVEEFAPGLPLEDWKARFSGFVWYDFAYVANGRGQFTSQVLRNYEFDGDLQETWIQGTLFERLDAKLGRQVVNWGRSDNVRVIDVLNPLDNREPGLNDIEDLRRPLGMLRFDFRASPQWSLQAIAIPEIRFDKNPPFGSDYYPIAIPPPPRDKPGTTEFAAAAWGVFEGWDLSFHYANVYDDLPRLRPVPAATPLGFDLERHHSRLHMGGTGANYTVGSWLFKGELAYLDGIEYLILGDGPAGAPPSTDEKPRLDAMIGVEYYGISETTIAIEAVNRHIFDYDDSMLDTEFTRENAVEYAIRYTAEWLNARLRTTAVALLFGARVQDGAVVRLQADYTFRDALIGTAGIVLYQGGDLLPLSAWKRNDRLFFELEYSF
jgi:hypothetical protein